MAAAWRFHNPVKIAFGAGALEGIGALVAGRPYALVTYGEPLFAALTDRVAQRAGPPAVVIDDIAPNPDFESLTASCARFGRAKTAPAAIVALGGGSVIDAAKVLAAAGGDFSRVRRHLEEGTDPDGLLSLPIIAVPTTAGTGSEVTHWATVWDQAKGRKHSLALPSLYPEQAVIDPELMLELPRGLTVSTALDALSHALESLWNRNANAVSTVFAVAAAREILDTLPRLVLELGDPALRSRMARAALNAGLAFSNTKTALAHSLSYPVTLRHGVPHGLACSFSLPMVMRAAIGTDADCDAALAEIFGPDLASGAARLADFLAELGVSQDPADYGVAEQEWRALIAAAFAGERGRNFIGSLERIEAEARQSPPRRATA